MLHSHTGAFIHVTYVAVEVRMRTLDRCFDIFNILT